MKSRSPTQMVPTNAPVFPTFAMKSHDTPRAQTRGSREEVAPYRVSAPAFRKSLDALFFRPSQQLILRLKSPAAVERLTYPAMRAYGTERLVETSGDQKRGISIRQMLAVVSRFLTVTPCSVTIPAFSLN